MNPPEPPDDRDDGVSTPTIIEGFTFDDLRKELDDHDLDNLREFLGKVDSEVRRTGPSVPTTLAALGPFRDLVEIGRGGMGVVYRARDPETGEDVAVKIPSPGLMLVPGARRMFNKEAEAVGRLDHPAVVPHRPLGEAGNRYYIVSDYCDGPDLEKWLKARNVPAPAREAARIIRELAGAIAHAHERGVLHRDVKPSNVLLPGSRETSDAESLSPRLTDFGLAKLLDAGPTPLEAATATGLVMGSPPYMAPEQAAGRRKEIDRRTDVYGLGAVLYELLTMRPPFRGDTPAETLGMVMNDDPVPIRVLRPGVPRSLETIALQCLEKDPARRFQTADALRDDLDAFLAGRRIQARRPGPIESLRRWARRRPEVATLAASTLAIGLILCAGVTAWTVALSRGRDRADQYVYDSRVQLALRAADDGQLVRAQPILQGLIPGPGGRDRREFAWRYLWNLCRSEARMLLGSDVDSNQFGLAPDGKKLAAGGDDGLQLYDLDREKPIWRVPTPGTYLYFPPVFSPDGTRIAFLTLDHEGEKPERSRYVEVRSADSGALLGRRVLPARQEIYSIAFRGDGRLSVVIPPVAPDTAPTAEILTWLDRGALPDAAPPIPVADHAVDSADGLRTAGVDLQGRFGVYDAATGRWTVLQDAPTADIGHSAFTQDGRLLAVAYDTPGEMRVFDAVGGSLLRRIPGLVQQVRGIAFQPEGEAFVVRTASQEVRLMDPSRGLDIRIFEPTSQVGIETKHLRFTPDGRSFFVHRSEFRGADRIEIRSADDGRLLGQTPGRHKAQTGGWAVRRGPRPELIYGLGRHAWRWDWTKTVDREAEPVLKAHNDEAWTVAYNSDGTLLATSSNNDFEPATIRIRTADGRLVREWTDSESTAADLAFSPDSNWIATAHLFEQRAIRIRRIGGEADPISVELPDGEWARCVEFHPDRPVVYAGGDRGSILAWDLARREVAWHVAPPPDQRVPKSKQRIHDMAMAPDGGRIAVVDDRGVVQMLNPGNGSRIAIYDGPSPMLAVAYSPDGRVVAAGDQEGRIHLLDAATARPIQVIPGDDCDLRCLAFSPDGRTLAAAGLGLVVRLWDPSTGEELLALSGHTAQINSVAFSPDGQTLASADHSGVVRFWHSPEDSTR